MIEIAAAIQEGAMAYLRRQFKTIAVILIPLAIVVFVTSTEVVKPRRRADRTALTFVQSGIFRTLAFIAGCALSGLTGFVGMSLAVRGNVRTAAAAKSGSLPAALKVAFRTGGVAGMFTVGLGLLGATIIIMLFQNTASAILIGFGFGGSLLALFLRVGGGIFTKAADVGADLVGKVEAASPRTTRATRPPSPTTWATSTRRSLGDVRDRGHRLSLGLHCVVGRQPHNEQHHRAADHRDPHRARRPVTEHDRDRDDAATTPTSVHLCTGRLTTCTHPAGGPLIATLRSTTRPPAASNGAASPCARVIISSMTSPTMYSAT